MNSIASSLITGAAVVVVIACGIVLWLYSRSQAKRFRRTLKLELRNIGNIAGRYELKAEEPTGSLRFKWALNGSPLGERQVLRVTNAARLLPPQVSAAKQSSIDGGDRQSGGSLKNASRAFAEVLMTIGYILPRSIGSPFISLGSELRCGQYAAERFSPMSGKVSRANAFVERGQVNAVGSSYQTFVPGVPPHAMAAVTPAAPVSISDVWAQTPAVQPGGVLRLDLTIEPVDVQQFRQYAFTVMSKSVEQPDQLVGENCSVGIAGMPTFQRLLPFVVFAGIALLVFACSSFILSNLRMLGS